MIIKFPKVPYWYFLFGPFILIALGFTMNEIVMALAHGTMPVQWPTGCDAMPVDDVHSCMTHLTHLKFLADWINVPDGVASPGDFLIWAYQYSVIPSLIAWLALILKDAQTEY